MRAPPSTFEFIEEFALRDPQRLALVEGDAHWTYGEIHLEIVRHTLVLERLGLRRGQRVAVSRPGVAKQLALLLACENLGAATGSFTAGADSSAPALFGLVDWVLSEQPLDPGPARLQLLDAAFDAQVAAIGAHGATPCPRVSLEPDEPLRISRTSGSSGISKFMLLNRRAQEYWIVSAARSSAATGELRLCADGPMVINIVYTRLCACLRHAGVLLSVPPGELDALGVTQVWALPMRLEALLRELPEGYRFSRRVEVCTAGGTLSPQLREKAVAVFGGGIVNRYGSNEAGLVSADLDPGGTGILGPGVDVRILGEDGGELPAGETGLIAVRTPAMPDGYLNDAEASQAFRGGWFHTGDMGRMVGVRKLQLAGRHDDLLNLGGIKVPAARLELGLRGMPGVRDCAAMAVNLEGGTVTVGVVLVLEDGASREEAMAHMQRAMSLGVATGARVLFLDALPRGAAGKLDRLALQRLLHAPRES